MQCVHWDLKVQFESGPDLKVRFTQPPGETQPPGRLHGETQAPGRLQGETQSPGRVHRETQAPGRVQGDTQAPGRVLPLRLGPPAEKSGAASSRVQAGGPTQDFPGPPAVGSWRGFVATPPSCERAGGGEVLLSVAIRSSV